MSRQSDELRKILGIKPDFKTQKMEALLAWRDRAVREARQDALTDAKDAIDKAGVPDPHGRKCWYAVDKLIPKHYRGATLQDNQTKEEVWTDTNSELDRVLDIPSGKLARAMSITSTTKKLAQKAAINQLLLKARRDEARHWDEHILGAPRKVTVNDKAKDRIAELDTQIQKGME